MFSLTPYHYGTRGGHHYFKPCGWQRIALRIDDNYLRDWAVAYHGTPLARAIRILGEGLKPPGCQEDIVHGQALSPSRKTLYVSPAIEYAAHPAYAKFADAGDNTWLQAVLQLRVRPGSFKRCPGTLRGKHWPRDLRFDPNCPSWDGLEWLLESKSDVRVTGVLF